MQSKQSTIEKKIKWKLLVKGKTWFFFGTQKSKEYFRLFSKVLVNDSNLLKIHSDWESFLIPKLCVPILAIFLSLIQMESTLQNRCRLPNDQTSPEEKFIQTVSLLPFEKQCSTFSTTQASEIDKPKWKMQKTRLYTSFTNVWMVRISNKTACECIQLWCLLLFTSAAAVAAAADGAVAGVVLLACLLLLPRARKTIFTAVRFACLFLCTHTTHTQRTILAEKRDRKRSEQQSDATPNSKEEKNGKNKRKERSKLDRRREKSKLYIIKDQRAALLLLLLLWRSSGANTLCACVCVRCNFVYLANDSFYMFASSFIHYFVAGWLLGWL